MANNDYENHNWKGKLASVVAIVVSLIVVGGCFIGGYIGYSNYVKNHNKSKKNETVASQQTLSQVQPTTQLQTVTQIVQQTQPQTTVQTTAQTQPQTIVQTMAPTTAQTQPPQPVTAVLGQLAMANAYGGGLLQYNNFYDNVGNYYSTGWGGGASEVDNGCDFTLDYAYQSFSGTVVLNGEYASSSKYSYSDRNHYDYVHLRIYGDGVLLYTSPIVVWGMEPDSFNVDVSNVGTLRLEINGANFIRLVNDSLIKK